MTDTSLNAWQLVQAFEALKTALNDFSRTLSEHPELPCYQPPADQLSHASTCFNQLSHQDQGDGRRTPQFHGVIALPDALLQQAAEINQLKADFQALATRWNRHYGRQRNRALSEVLRHAGHARVQLKLCYRQIPILEQRPEKILFSWYTSGRSIRKITAVQAYKALQAFDTSQSHILTQLDQLSYLADNTPLAQVQQQAPVIRANISWRNSKQEIERRAFNAALPILIPEPDKGLPHIRDRVLEPAPRKRARQTRSDQRIMDEPFLPSIRVHKYKDHT